MDERHSRQVRLFFLLALIQATLIFSSFGLYNYFLDVSEQDRWVAHTSEVITEVESISSAIKDIEGSMRGYLITKDGYYLEGYQAALIETTAHFTRVRELTADNPEQQNEMAPLERLIESRLDILKIAFERVQKGQSPMSPDMVSRSKAVTTALRTQLDKVKGIEKALLGKRTASAEQSKDIFVLLLIAATLVIAFVILIAFLQIARNQARTQRESEERASQAEEKNLLAELSKEIGGDISLDDAGDAALRFLSEKMGFLAGKLWLVERGGLNLVAHYGVDKSAANSTSIGLVRSALDRGEVWTISEVPQDYWKVLSGLGETKPSHLTFVPFKFQGRKIGVVELASFEKNGPLTAHRLEALAESIGISINAAHTRSQLQNLLEETQSQSEELQAQQEELKSSNEELEQQARALESQQQSLNIKNKELENAQAELEGRALELQRSSQYKSDFLAKMSHELRTPLNGLLILSTLLIENKEKNLTENQLRFARSIHGAGNDLLFLINDILDLSKIEARKLSLHPEEFTLGSLFESKRRTFGPQADAKQLNFINTLTPELANLKFFTDRQRLEQILRNFISNAIKFTEKGSITLDAKLNQITNEIEIGVVDTGVGIPANKQNTIFEAFEQADSSVSRKYGGTGLGLTISRELATLLGGKITLSSEEGKGSRFAVTVPLNLPDQVESEPTDTTPKRKVEPQRVTATPEMTLRSNDRVRQAAQTALQSATGAGKTILLVEDDENFRVSVVEAVKSYGFTAIEAADGEVALAILQSHVPDAILLDIKLPGISGLGILEMIKQMPHLRHVPVHMISALEYQHNALRMGALGYLTKPVTIEKVHAALGRIESLLSKKLRRVLLIEDDERQNLAISQLIAGNDLEVVSVKTGKEAVEALKREGFDCIVLDLTLPDISGVDLLSELRALDISLPPVVIYTGKDLSDEEERYLRKYSESIIIKGARSPERLLDEVNLFLHRVESLLPEAKREMLSSLRSQEKVFESKTVLVVDDDIRNIFAMTGALEARGLQVRVARDGVEALEALDYHSDIDIVLMDIMMPRMDGLEAMKRIRQNSDQRIRALPVIALTAKAMREDHEKCMAAGASDYLPKPVNLENLTTILKVWLAPKGFLS